MSSADKCLDCGRVSHVIGYARELIAIWGWDWEQVDAHIESNCPEATAADLDCVDNLFLSSADTNLGDKR